MKLTLSSSYTLLFAIIILGFFLVANLAILGAGLLSFNPGAVGRPVSLYPGHPGKLTPSLATASATPTASFTPFQPLPPTPTATPTSTYTATLTETLIPSLTATPYPTRTRQSVTDSPVHTLEPTQTPGIEPTMLEPTQTPNTEPTVAEPTQDTSQPDAAQVDGVAGHSMWFSLDCEAAAAIGLADFFGVSIDHMDFLATLPYTDDPETGFVGSYKDTAGNIPPYSYGVHAAPVAKLLRAYGLGGAVAKKNLPFERIKKEIAAGRPVMVWVIGSVQYGTPVSYTAASTGNTTIVAAYEHTVLVVGYDENYVSILDGVMHYDVLINQFLKSWGVLGNMAIVVNN